MTRLALCLCALLVTAGATTAVAQTDPRLVAAVRKCAWQHRDDEHYGHKKCNC